VLLGGAITRQNWASVVSTLPKICSALSCAIADTSLNVGFLSSLSSFGKAKLEKN